MLENYIGELDTEALKGVVGIDIRNTLRDYVQSRVPSELNPGPEDLEDERERKVFFLSSCLNDVRSLQATNPKDKIYGVHALYTSVGIQMPAVDYSKSLSQVYEGAAVAMIIWSRTLKVLGYACHDGSFLPSWVPDFSNGTIKDSTPSGDATGESKVTASSPSVLNPRPGELCVRGKVVGRVVSAATIFPTRPEQCELGILKGHVAGVVEEVDTLRLMIDQIKFCRQLYQHLQDSPDCSEDAEDTFLDLLNQARYSESSQVFDIWLDILQYPETKHSLRVGEELVAEWQRAESAAGAAAWTTELTNCAIIAASIVSNGIQRDGSLLDYGSDILDLTSQLFPNLSGKAMTLVRLDSPRITTIATGRASTQKEDSVVLLEGSEWPVILRRVRARKWRFVGPAFIPGMMDSELWQDEVRDGRISGLGEFYLI